MSDTHKPLTLSVCETHTHCLLRPAQRAASLTSLSLSHVEEKCFAGVVNSAAAETGAGTSEESWRGLR